MSPVEIKAAPPPPDYGFGLRGGSSTTRAAGSGSRTRRGRRSSRASAWWRSGAPSGSTRCASRAAWRSTWAASRRDGSAFIGLANEDQPYDFPEEFAPPGLGFLAGRRLDTVSIGIGGEAKIKVPIVGEVPLINSYVFYQYPAYAEFGGGFKFNVAERFSVDGKVGGFAAPIQRTFNL